MKEAMVFSFTYSDDDFPVGGTTFVCSDFEYKKVINNEFEIIVKKRKNGSYSNTVHSPLLSLEIQTEYKIFVIELQK